MTHVHGSGGKADFDSTLVTIDSLACSWPTRCGDGLEEKSGWLESGDWIGTVKVGEAIV